MSNMDAYSPAAPAAGHSRCLAGRGDRARQDGEG
jgi:hypothetical protein